MPLEHTARNCWVSLATAVACCLLSGCGGTDVDPITANELGDVDILVQELARQGASGGGAVVVLPDPEGFASLRGTFKINESNGALKPLVNLTTSGNDRTYCGPVRDDRIVVDSQKNLKNVLIFLSMKLPAAEEQRYGKWIHESYRETESAVLTGAAAFDQEKCRFKSRIFAMRATQTVKILNSDTVGHNTNVKGPLGVASINPTLPGGSDVDYTPGGPAKSPFAVSCSVHPWMSSWMISLDHPYFAVTAADGSFEIKDLPAGVELTFSLWHEKTQWLKNVDVVPADQIKTDKRGKFKMTLSAGQETEIAVDLDASLLN
jgi:hypothetical protein